MSARDPIQKLSDQRTCYDRAVPKKKKTSTTIVCVYCKEAKPPSKEHALQRSLGGNLILRDVCRECNNGFADIDGALAGSSFVSLIRVGTTPREAFETTLGGDHFFTDPKSGVTIEVTVQNQMRSAPYPQVHFLVNGGTASLALLVKDRADSERLDRFVRERISAGQLRSLGVKLGPPEAGATARLVMRREGSGFVRGQSQADVERLLAFLETHWATFAAMSQARFDGADPPQTQEVKTPSVRITQEIHLNDVNRAVAKIAFNIAAARLGAAFVLGPEFDPVREYIRGTDVRVPVVGPGELAVDNRFVTSVPPGTEPAIPCDDHAVAIFGNSTGLLAWVTLYKTSNFIVRLSEVAPRDVIPVVHLFSATRKRNRPLDLEEILQRLRTRVSDRH